MDINDLIRGFVLVSLIIAFLGMVFWAWSKDRQHDFEFMSRLPLDEDDALETKKQKR